VYELAAEVDNPFLVVSLFYPSDLSTSNSTSSDSAGQRPPKATAMIRITLMFLPILFLMAACDQKDIGPTTHSEPATSEVETHYLITS
jgi:hypothetical protein